MLPIAVMTNAYMVTSLICSAKRHKMLRTIMVVALVAIAARVEYLVAITANRMTIPVTNMPTPQKPPVRVLA